VTVLLDTEGVLGAIAAGLEDAPDGDRRRLVSATAPVLDVDPCALAFEARLATDRWFCWEQPDRDFALAALGSAQEVVSRGPQRFAEVAGDCLALARGRIGSGEDGLPAGTGPVWTGGFAFADEGGASPVWSSFPPALMVLPEMSLCRRGGDTYLTLNALAGPGVDPEAAIDRLRARLASLREASMPMLDPSRLGRTEFMSVRPPGEFEAAVAAAVRRIRDGEIEKVVLAREVMLRAPAAFDVAAVYGAMRELFPACFCICCGSAEGAFVGASPELLIRRSGASASTVALAGSARRSSDPSVDDHIGERLIQSPKERAEHEIVVRRIVRRLRPHSVWVEPAPQPGLVKIANIQHLATPIHAQLAEAHSAVELTGLLHPTPAIGGEPWPAAGKLIDELEGMDRGWYAGPIGWMDATEDGEFCVGIRSALLRDREARLFAGNGIVADSDPEAELAETEPKLEAMLPLLSG
jgi:salicylate biosynthesis isochorismate synthase/menaquinone-specific isochorismate synthase